MTPEELLKKYDRYLRVMAASFNQDFFLDDLILEGQLAIIDAHNRYDPAKGSFMALASTLVKYAMMNFLTKNARIIYAPAYAHKDSLSTLSLETQIGTDNSILSDFIASEVSEPQKDLSFLTEALNRLIKKDDQKDMFLMYNGLYDYEVHSQQAIGKKYKCSKENVRQIINKIKNVLKNDEILKYHYKQMAQGN